MKLRMVFLVLFGVVLGASCSPSVEISPTSTSLPQSFAATATAGLAATPIPTSTPLPPQVTSTLAPSGTPVQSAVLSTRAPAFISMIDPMNGWGLRENRVLRTADGGHTWINASPGEAAASPDSLTGCFLDKDTAWVILPGVPGSGSGRVFRTRDGGATWIASPAPFERALLQALNSQILFAMADRGAAAGSQAVDIYRSPDGGVTWDLMTHVDPQGENPDGLPFSGSKSGFSFRDEQHGWVTGFVPMEGFTYLYATADGGKTWKQQTLTLPDQFMQAQVGLESPRFFSGQEGLILARFATGEGSFLGVYRTGDGGVTWQMGAPVKATGPFAAGGPLDFYAWDQGMLYASHDGGQTWKVEPAAAPGEQPSAMQFVDPAHGWLTLGDNSLIRLYGSADQGKVWTLLAEDH